MVTLCVYTLQYVGDSGGSIHSREGSVAPPDSHLITSNDLQSPRVLSLEGPRPLPLFGSTLASREVIRDRPIAGRLDRCGGVSFSPPTVLLSSPLPAPSRLPAGRLSLPQFLSSRPLPDRRKAWKAGPSMLEGCQLAVIQWRGERENLLGCYKSPIVLVRKKKFQWLLAREGSSINDPDSQESTTGGIKEGYLVMDDKRMRKLEEEDRLSALPDDLLHQILSSFNDTLFSATTSILSRRWPRLWVENPFLFFTDVPTRAHFMDSVDKALERYDCHGSLFINKFHIKIAEASNAARLNAWVGFAARHNVQVLHLKVPCECRHRLHLRLWECIREINIEYNLLIRFVKLPPPSPTFHSLKDLTLKGVHFSSKGYNLGDLLSYHCPWLESLKIVMVTGLKNLKISHPELSSLHIALGVPCIREFILSAKKLADLFVENLFLGRSQNVVLDISAPSLSTFHWTGVVPPGVTLGDFPKLKWGLFLFYSYCEPITKQLFHQSIRKSLKSFAHAQCLHVYIGYWRFSACLDFLDETPALLRVKQLSMFVCSKTHVFGQSVFNLLRICLGIEELHVKIARTNGLEGIARYRRCSCYLKQCWRSQTIPLNDLKRIEIKGFQGAQHEVDFVKLLLTSATILETLTIDYLGGTNSSSSVAQELLELPRASSRVIISQRF